MGRESKVEQAHDLRTQETYTHSYVEEKEPRKEASLKMQERQEGE